ncbi:methionyl-tRNA formyltransferase [uncultured Thiothrix sp.]|jgi:methionyl-tRNA formyltransferase|uniref:methionyl-tRNA formyltransferase n=1 Tax=uncultured Thiothrix sp. TaxID=223185 RepID=UPI00260FBF20|nr:methionyl-tRNA formyltransferase [uncultured Thiothrix sp.]HMT93704.1 methionyl-tRNA formyltransferase [Thiolinea sp.]
MSAGLRIVYAGTPEFAVPALQALLASQQHDVVAVYTQPDRPAGRGRKLQFSPVKEVAVAASIPVEQPVNFKSAAAKTILSTYQADVMVVAAYGLILPQGVLDTPRYGCLNIHGSLLPRWRGAAPIQRAIQAGDALTGVTIMQMAAGLDTGDMLLKTACPIALDDGGQSIHDKLAQQGAEALLAVLEQVQNHTVKPEVQNEQQVCYAHKLTKAEAEIDWTQSAAMIDRKIRAFDAWPTAYTHYKGLALRLFASQALSQTSTAPAGTVVAETRAGIDIVAGDGQLVRILQLQMAGGKRLTAAEFLNARSLLGERFSKVAS